MHVVFSENPPKSLGNPNCAHLTSCTRTCTCFSTFCSIVGVRAILTRSPPVLWNESITANLWCRLEKKLWLGIRLIGYDSAVRLALYNLQPRTSNAYPLTLCSYNEPSLLTTWSPSAKWRFPARKLGTFLTTPSITSEKHFGPLILYYFESSGCTLTLLRVL